MSHRPESRSAIIRELVQADAPAYRELMLLGLEQHAESFRISLRDEGEPMIPFVRTREGAFTLGAWLTGDTLAGTVSFERDMREKFRHKGLLYRMYVRDDASGMGIGNMLIRETIARARKMEGLERINLTVIASNSRAKRLYASGGFVSFSLERKGLKMGESYYDEEQMTLSLHESGLQP
ncbi:MAG TPA: GNAT family N-acetyltransferase [Burkholderiales bacterium]|nr:GNAT family N-acetyltransferase [Burkholderiales bacterium]